MRGRHDVALPIRLSADQCHSATAADHGAVQNKPGIRGQQFLRRRTFDLVLLLAFAAAFRRGQFGGRWTKRIAPLAQLSGRLHSRILLDRFAPTRCQVMPASRRGTRRIMLPPASCRRSAATSFVRPRATGAATASAEAAAGEHQRTTSGIQNHIATNNTSANAPAFAGLAAVSRRNLRIK